MSATGGVGMVEYSILSSGNEQLEIRVMRSAQFR